MTETVGFTSSPQIFEDANGIRYQLVITGEAEITRGPLGRFLDLADQITAEGGTVPPELVAVLLELQAAKVES